MEKEPVGRSEKGLGQRGQPGGVEKEPVGRSDQGLGKKRAARGRGGGATTTVIAYMFNAYTVYNAAVTAVSPDFFAHRCP